MHDKHHELIGYTDQVQAATKHYKSFTHKIILCNQNTDIQLIQAFHIHCRIYIYVYHAHLPLVT
jgi:hypothetical protein